VAVSLVHLAIISYTGYAYLNDWIELDMSKEATKIMLQPEAQTKLDISRNRLKAIYEEHGGLNYTIGICVRVLMLIHLMNFMMFASYAGIAYKDPRQLHIIYKC
jgi:hypothetical protein